jgi:hypothetical protein
MITSLSKVNPRDLKEVIQGSRKGPSEQSDSDFVNFGICSIFLIRSGFLRTYEFSYLVVQCLLLHKAKLR